MFAIPLLFLASTNIPSWQLILISLAMPLLFRISKESKIDRFIGELSYPVFMFHFAILIAFDKISSEHPGLLDYFPKGIWVAVIAILVSIITVIFVENRVNSYRGYLLTPIQKAGRSNATEPNYSRYFGLIYVVCYFVFPFALVAYVYLSQQ
jgi:peptidoglycan/LPS O-acetylase OafA/YrhL